MPEPVPAYQVCFGSQLLEDVDHHAAGYPMLSSKIAGGRRAHAALEPVAGHRTAQFVISARVSVVSDGRGPSANSGVPVNFGTEQTPIAKCLCWFHLLTSMR